MTKITKGDIIKYYEEAEIAYKDIWHLDSCYSMHYGFWERGVHNLKTALIKENEVLSQMINTTSDDIVLDAGCGIGGSSFYLASKYNCSVYGISLSAKQIEKAVTASTYWMVSHLTKFIVRDYHNTEFNNNFFTVVWFLESFCHSNDINTVLKEAYRVLKPGGRLMIADGFTTKDHYSKEENILLNNWLNNWAINDIATINSLTKALKDVGFSGVIVTDYSDKIIKSSFRLYIFATLAMAIGKWYNFFGKTYGNRTTINNTIGAKYQYPALKKNLWRYYVITAVK